MIIWPAIIKYSGDNELFYVSDQLAWESNEDLQSYRFEVGDLLIDTHGVSYSLFDNSQISQLCPSGCVNLNELTELIRQHASELGNCCTSKLGFPSIAVAIKCVASFDSE